MANYYSLAQNCFSLFIQTLLTFNYHFIFVLQFAVAAEINLQIKILRARGQSLPAQINLNYEMIGCADRLSECQEPSQSSYDDYKCQERGLLALNFEAMRQGFLTQQQTDPYVQKQMAYETLPRLKCFSSLQQKSSWGKVWQLAFIFMKV